MIPRDLPNGRLTPLQIALRAFRDALLDAREELDVREYLTFLSLAIDIVAREAARCALWDVDGEDAA